MMKKLMIFFLAVSLFAACNNDKNGKDRYDRDREKSSREKDDYRNSDDDKSSRDDSRTDDRKTDDTENTGHNWPASEINAFLTNCESNGAAIRDQGFDPAKYCNCMMVKVQELYPDVKDAARITEADMESPSFQTYIKNCLLNSK
jgi:hypothetical protein